VSYALPALIALGYARHQHRPSLNPVLRYLRNVISCLTLKKLIDLQPANGGFLEATPLTSFVVMSLAGSGQADHPVTRRGLEFLIRSVRADGSWPIDTNLATWITTLSIDALSRDPQFAWPEEDRERICDWLLAQRFTRIHPYTQA